MFIHEEMSSRTYMLRECMFVSGHAAYGQAVKLVNDSSSPSGYRVGATQFMFYHTITRTSSDFITSYKSALDISNNVTRTLREAFPGSNYTVFPYRCVRWHRSSIV